MKNAGQGKEQRAICVDHLKESYFSIEAKIL